MNLNEKRAEAYLQEARLSLESAQAIFDEAHRTKKQLWANIVKTSYDGMEQAISAALAKIDVIIPKEHPAKISAFINNIKADEKNKEALLFWLRKRSKSQYVDVIGEKVQIPHETFNEADAEKAIDDCKLMIGSVSKLTNKK